MDSYIVQGDDGSRALVNSSPVENYVVDSADPEVFIIEGELYGPQGQKGDKGDKGDPGASTGDKTFTQSFTSQSTVAVAHNLGKRPAVTVIDSAGDECEGSVRHNDLNNLTVTFSASFSGVVLCN